MKVKECKIIQTSTHYSHSEPFPDLWSTGVYPLHYITSQTEIATDIVGLPEDTLAKTIPENKKSTIIKQLHSLNFIILIALLWKYSVPVQFRKYYVSLIQWKC